MSAPQADLVIRSGTVFDGSGSPGRTEDLAIRDGRVLASGPKLPHKGAREIDAAGCWVTPGFFDIHTHYDAEVEVLPGLEESVRHGVTNVVFGNCSLSAAVGSESDILSLFCRVESLPRDLMEKWMKGRITWDGPAGYYRHLDELPLGPNVCTFLGHSNIRIRAMGLDRSLKVPKARADEIEKMKRLVSEALDAGYLGLSVDMLPWHRMDADPYRGISVPSQQAHVSEYRQLAEVVRRAGRVLQATPNALLKKTVVEIVRLSTGIGRKPLKATMIAAMDVKTDRRVWKLATGMAHTANRFLNADFKWQALAEPFLNFCDGPYTPLFEEFPAGIELISATPEARHAMLASPAFRKQFREEWQDSRQRVFHRNFADMWIASVPEPGLAGKSVAEAAKERGEEPIECFLNLMERHDTAFRWKTEVSNDREEIRARILAHPDTLPGFNDSGAHNRNMAFQDGALQMLRLVQKYPDILPVGKAVRKLTRETAEWFGVDAGSLKTGALADAVVIDPKTLPTGLSAPLELVDPRLDGAMRLVKRSDSVVRQVVVGGKVTFENGAFPADYHKKKYGRLLRAGA